MTDLFSKIQTFISNNKVVVMVGAAVIAAAAYFFMGKGKKGKGY